MPLRELNEELYKKNSNLPKKETTVFRPEKDRPNINEYNPRISWQNGVKKTFHENIPPAAPKRKYKKYALLFGITIIAVGIGVFMWWQSTAFKSFDKSRVELSTNLPKNIESGQKVPITINYFNNNKTALRNVKLQIDYPEDSLPLGENFSEPVYSFSKTVDIGEIASGEKGKLEFPTIIFGASGDNKEFKIKMSFSPENFASKFENDYSGKFTISGVPLAVNWSFPEKTVSGQEFEAKLFIVNSSANDFYNARINLKYPSGFSFSDSDPKPSEEENVWNFKKLEGNGEQTIVIRGRLSGQSEESKSFEAQIGIVREKNGVREFVLYDEIKTPTKITSSPLFVRHEITNITGGIAKAGNILSYKVYYKNTTNVAIEKVEVSVSLTGEVFDLTSLDIQRGSFDSSKKVISWKGADVADLNILTPNKEGNLSFSIRVKKPLPIETFSNKNFTITSKAAINSKNIPASLAGTNIAGEDTLTVKIGGDMSLRQKAYYFESPIGNSGPIPPKVGETTTYNIILQITSTSNDIENVVAETYLPAYVSWEGKVEPKGSNISYDDETRKIIWNLGTLPAQTGILLPLKQVAFQVALTPSLSHLDKTIDLVGEAGASGYDAFTKEKLEDFSSVVMTNLPDDPFVSSAQGKITQ